MKCPHCGIDVTESETEGPRPGEPGTDRCPLCSGELPPDTPVVEVSSPARAPISAGWFMFGLIAYPVAWLMFDFGLFFAAATLGGGWREVVILGVVLYAVATFLTFRFGSKSVAMGALVGLAVPLLAFGACWRM